MIANPPDETLRYAARLQLARRHLLPFIKHVFPGEYVIQPETALLCEALERFYAKVVEGGHPRLLIIMPPRVGKSEMIKHFLAWVLGQQPDWHVGLVSFGDDLAWEHSADTRGIVADEPFAEIFGGGPTPVALDPDMKSVKHWKVQKRRGGFRAAGINGALTGKGFKIVAFDDPTKGRKEADSVDYREEQWRQFNGTFKPRLEPGGNGVILDGTSWHADDIISRVQRENQANLDEPLADHWEILHIAAQALPGRIDPLGREVGEWMGGRRTVHEWEHERANTPPREWAAQFLGIPTPDEGQIFYPYDDFKFEEPPADKGLRYGFVDTSHANKRDSDYSGILVAQIEPDRTIGILDVFRGRLQFPELKRTAKAMYDQHGMTGMMIEDYNAGRSLIQEFQRDSGMRVGRYNPWGRDKLARAHAASDIYKWEGRQAPWRIRMPKQKVFPSGLPCSIFLDELTQFQPGGAIHDDLVDCFTMCCILIGTRDQTGRREVVQREFAFA